MINLNIMRATKVLSIYHLQFNIKPKDFFSFYLSFVKTILLYKATNNYFIVKFINKQKN